MAAVLKEKTTAYVNGKLLTVDANDTIAQAMLVAGERIIAVGTTEEIRALAPDHAKEVDLEGRTVIPGLIDAHVHAELTCVDQKLGILIEIPKINTVEEILNMVAERASITPKGQWILARGPNAMASKLADKRLPTRAELDKVAPDHPVAVFSAIHICVLNTLAIEKTGYWHETRLPLATSMGRDRSTGEPSGVYTELWSSDQTIMMPWDDEMVLHAQREGMMDYYVRHGITSIYELPYSIRGIRNWQTMRNEGSLPARVRMYLTHPEPVNLYEFLKMGIGMNFGDDWLSIGGIKLFVDGVMRHADGYYMSDIKWTREELYDIVQKAHDAGLQLWLHTLCPPAIRFAVEAFEAAITRNPRKDHRHRIEHLGDRWTRTFTDGSPFVPDDLKVKIKQLGIVPVSTPQHISAFPDRPGVPSRTLLNEGYIFPGASDTTGAQPESCNPWYGFGCLVTRRNLYGKVLTPEECLTPLESLRINTLYSAWCGFEESKKGSLEPGKLADFCILNEDLLEMDPERIQDMTVAATVVGGKATYTAPSFKGL
ncbi:MAG: amidohydrolase [Candidatus Limiplasma sp.]|nr:amidohydrolase [Candidatus Limiplasma sp.]